MSALRTAACVAALLAGLACVRPAAAAEPDLDALLGEVRTLVREKRYPLALDSLRLLARQLQDLRLDEIRAAFPEPGAGWQAEPAAGLLGDDEVWGRRVEGRRTYVRQGGDARIDLTIDLRSPLGPAVALSFNPLYVSGDPLARVVTVGGEQGLLRVFPDTGDADLRILAGREILVTLVGRGVRGPQPLLDLARHIDFPLLRSRSGI
jgi:hypothetical protein